MFLSSYEKTYVLAGNSFHIKGFQFDVKNGTVLWYSMCLQKTVYVFSNRADEGSEIYKVGCTRDVESRRRTYLSYWPLGCDVKYSRHCVNGRKVESFVHRALSTYRFGHHGREFFKCPLDLIKATIDSATALRGGESTNAAQAAARSLSDELIAELNAADMLIIGAPMYNFGMPSTLKAWFDHVLRADITFRYSESGPEGLIKGKRAVVIVSRGGLYSEGPAQVMDSQEPHLRNLLGFMGITDVSFLRAEKLAFGQDVREQSIDAVRQQIGDTIGEACRKAA